MKVAIAGAGQVGGSIGLSARQAGIANDVFYYDISVDHVQQLNEIAASRGFGETVHATHKPAHFRTRVTEADLVILATPQNEFKNLATEIVPCMKSGAILTDVGSLRQNANLAIGNGVWQSGRDDISFWGSHPNKGNEGHGPSAAEIGLYKNAVVFLTPLAEDASDEQKITHGRLAQFWKGLWEYRSD